MMRWFILGLLLMADMAFPSAPGGHVAIELIGDKTLLMPYIFDARREMAQFKAYYGIDEKRAAGEWVGFHRAEKRYPDGVTIEMITNGPQDILRISGVRPPKVVTVGEERPQAKPKPYMWIGARVQWEKINSDMLSYDALGLMVIEPADNGLVTGEGQNWGRNGHAIYLTPWAWLPDYAFDMDAQTASFESFFGERREGGEWVPKGRIEFQVKDGVPAGARMRFTRSLLRHYDIASMPSSISPDAVVLGPYDPINESDEALAQRSVPSGIAHPAKTLWDQVVVLDPDEGNAEPTSNRPEDAAVMKVLQEKTGVYGDTMVIPGQYVVKVVAIGPDCGYTDPTPPPYPLKGWDEQLLYFDPLPVEIEVRVNKYPDTITKTVEVQIPRYTNYFHSMWPFGDWKNADSDCQPEFERPNNHIPAWWQGAILVDVFAGSIDVVEEEYAPYPVFDTNNKWDPESLACNTRKRTDTYVFVQPNYDDARVPGDVAQQVLVLLYQMYYPAQNYRTYAQILAAANAIPLVSGQLYLYDMATNVFTVVPTVPLWEDVIRRQTILAGKNFAKILFGAVIPNPDLCTTTHTAFTGDDTVAYECDPPEVKAKLAQFCSGTFP